MNNDSSTLVKHDYLRTSSFTCLSTVKDYMKNYVPFHGKHRILWQWGFYFEIQGVKQPCKLRRNSPLLLSTCSLEGTPQKTWDTHMMCWSKGVWLHSITAPELFNALKLFCLQLNHTPKLSLHNASRCCNKIVIPVIICITWLWERVHPWTLWLQLCTWATCNLTF